MCDSGRDNVLINVRNKVHNDVLINARRISKLMIIAAVLFSAVFVLFSCTNLFDDINVESPSSSSFVTLTGTVSSSGRMAIPSPTFAGKRYTVTATAPGEASVSGSVNDSNSTFSISLQLGKIWTITLKMEAKGPADPAFKAVFEGTYAFDHELRAEDAMTPLSIVLLPISTGTGDIDLAINAGSYSFEVEVLSEPVAGEWANKHPDYTNGIKVNGLKGGAYTILIVFKNATTHLEVYSCTQTINVCPNMTTDRWISGGSSSPISSDGTFAITPELVQAYAQTQIYVGANQYQMRVPADTNMGTAYEPLATLGAALSRITDSTKDYTIRISGTQSGNFTLGTTDTAPNFAAQSVTLLGQRGLNASGEPQDVLNGNNSGTVLTISTTAPVTIRKLKITGGNAHQGGGINALTTGAKITLESGALITDNTAEIQGGGVYVYGASNSLVMNEGAKISENHISDQRDDGGYGGLGIYFGCVNTTAESNRPEFVMNGGEISDHTSTKIHKGIGLRLDRAKFVMNGGKITRNSGVTEGGNISSGGTSVIIINGGEISYGSIEPTFSRVANAGAILLQDTQLTMTGGKIIKNSVTPYSGKDGNGGAILVYDGASMTITGGEISDNYINPKNSDVHLQGGAIHVAGGGGAVTIGGDAYIPEGANGEHGLGKNDIVLCQNKTITIGSALNKTGTVATVIPGKYEADYTIVEKGDGVSAADFADACRKIAVNCEGYILGSDGKLKAPALDLPSSSNDIVSGNTYVVADFSAIEKLADFSREGCSFSGVTLKLDSDITIDSEWTPIGNGTAFNGTFDGNEKTVTFAPETNAEAFFGAVGGTVKNLKVAGSASVAGIAKTANSSSVIENCESSATIISSTGQEYCAGIVATVQSNAKIKGCVNTGSITSNLVLSSNSSSYGAGGIAGRVNSDGIIESCVNTGSVTGPNAGGIAASTGSRSVIRNAYNYGDITSTELHAGGIAAAMIGSGAGVSEASHVYNCFNSGSVTAEGTENTVYAGGIVGKLGWGNGSYAHNCLNIGNVFISESAKSNSYAGALFGLKDSNSQIDFCYYKEGVASSGFGAGNVSPDADNECIKAEQSGTNNAVISADVTLDGTTYSAETSTVLSLLNAWVTKNSTDGMYYEWEAGENHWPKLKTE